MTKQLEKNIYLLDHSEKNILVHPRTPPPLESKLWPPYRFQEIWFVSRAQRYH